MCDKLEKQIRCDCCLKEITEQDLKDRKAIRLMDKLYVHTTDCLKSFKKEYENYTERKSFEKWLF